MSTPANIHQQISWMKDQLAHMQRKLPIGVRNGNITQAQADGKFAAAEGALRTLEDERDRRLARRSTMPSALGLTPEDHRKRGEEAFEAGRPRDSHGMNWDAAALKPWLHGYDTAANRARLAANQRNLPLARSAEV